MCNLSDSDFSADSLSAANINPTTFLATDYLNHFNEMVMLMELLSDMPECAEDIQAWEPRSYCEHFDHSGYREKELAIAAYERADEKIKADLDTLVEEIDAKIVEAQKLTEDGVSDDVYQMCMALHAEVVVLIDQTSSLINGHGLVDDNENDHSSEKEQQSIDLYFTAA